MKYLGIDYGTKKVGISISDEAGSFAFPKLITTPQRLFSEIEMLAKKEQLVGIVIGKSVGTNGAENSINEEIEKVGELLKKIAPVFFEQEMFSSVEAHRYQTKAGERDDSAAAIILQRFLDKKTK